MSKILYFEDDTVLAGMIRVILERAGFEVVWNENPPTNPVELVLQEKPDLIFTDTLMPKMDGFKMTELLKNDPRTKDVPIFGMSNLGQQEHVNKAIELDMVNYWVSTHYTPTEVVEKIRSILRGKNKQNAKVISAAI